MSDAKTELIAELKRHVAAAEPVAADFGAIIAEDASELVAALFALAPSEQVRGQWAGGIDFEMADALGKIAWVSSESEQVEAFVDAALAGGEAATLAEVLARAGIVWDSSALIDLLDHDASRRAAALILAVARPEEVADWLEECEVVEDALEVLRAAAIDVAIELRDGFTDWHDELADVEDVDFERARIDGLFAVLDPKGYARRMLAGDAEADWLRDLPIVADFLQVYGPTEWLEVLGFLEAVEDPAIELASFLAVSAAAGIGFEEPDEQEARQLIDLLTVEPDADPDEWEPLATGLHLGFAVAVAPDDDLGLLGAQVAAHERLISFDIHSPGIPGLPLSATYDDALDLDASKALLEAVSGLDELSEASVLGVVRTLSDLRGLVDHDADTFSEHAEAWVDAFMDSSSRAVRLAARQLMVPLDREAARREASRLDQADDIEAALAFGRNGDQARAIAALEEHAHLEGPLGLDCTRRLAAIGTDAALEAIARLWKTGSVFRAAYYRDALVEGVVGSQE
ncbi:MAG: hypothetical protein ACLFVJ_19350 [Persicimonas sp.]